MSVTVTVQGLRVQGRIADLAIDSIWVAAEVGDHAVHKKATLRGGIFGRLDGVIRIAEEHLLTSSAIGSGPE